MHLNDEKLLAEPGVRVALATALYKDESLSLGRAAKLAGMVLVEFMQHVSRLGIPVVRGAAATVRQDVNNLKAWPKNSPHITVELLVMASTLPAKLMDGSFAMRLESRSSSTRSACSYNRQSTRSTTWPQIYLRKLSGLLFS